MFIYRVSACCLVLGYCRQLLAAGLLLSLASYSIPAQSVEQEKWIEQFLIALEGDWIGRAELTPIGPRPYNIRFAQTASGKVEGSVATGANTTHYWTFFKDTDRLRIRFLSTFAGNEKPTFLDVDTLESEAILFRAADPPLLSVRVSVSSERLHINVYHWDKPHVEIRLTRSPEASANQ